MFSSSCAPWYRHVMFILLAVPALACGVQSGQDLEVVARGGSVEPVGSEVEDYPSQVEMAEGSAAEFFRQIHTHSGTDDALPTSVAEYLELSDLVAVGQVVGFGDGRLEHLGDDESGEPIVARFVNLQVRLDEIVSSKEELKDQDSSGNVVVDIEYSWPRNLELGVLRRSAPVGQRVIVAGSQVDPSFVARTSDPLVERGVLAPGRVSSQLYAVPSYGLIVEGSEAKQAFGLHGQINWLALSEQLGVDIADFDAAVDLLKVESISDV